MIHYKLIDTPIFQNHKLGEHQDQVTTDRERYKILVGILIYLCLTNPNIAYVVSIVSQFMHNSIEKYISVVIQMLYYLKYPLFRRLMFSKNNNINTDGYTYAY